jgi:hypothetical protein
VQVLDNIRHNLAVYNGQNEGRLASDAVTVHRLDWTDPATYPQVRGTYIARTVRTAHTHRTHANV